MAKISIVLEKHERRFLYHLFKHIAVLFAWFQQQMAYKFTSVRSNKARHEYAEVPDLRIEWHPLDIRHYWHINRCPMCGCFISKRIGKRAYVKATHHSMLYQQPHIVCNKYIEHYHYYVHTQVLCSKECVTDWDSRVAEANTLAKQMEEIECEYYVSEQP